jgi:Plavaka transposase
MHYFLLPSFLSPKVSVLRCFCILFDSEYPSIAASKRQRKKPLYQKFCRQLYHACLSKIFHPLKAGMTTPEVVKCPDGHFRRAVYGLGPYIADYPEQVWLSGIVQGWCPKYVTLILLVFSLRNHSASRCLAKPNFLDDTSARRRTHKKTDFLINSFNPGILWDDFGIRSDVVVSQRLW